jgi:hypothetical protein
MPDIPQPPKFLHPGEVVFQRGDRWALHAQDPQTGLWRWTGWPDEFVEWLDSAMELESRQFEVHSPPGNLFFIALHRIADRFPPDRFEWVDSATTDPDRVY